MPKSKEEEKFFSPRKLLKEYDQEEQKPRAKKARTKLNYDSASSANGEQEEKQEQEEEASASAEASASEDANDELFSPALKPPRASRSTSASPPNARVRLETTFTNTSAQPDEQMEEEVAPVEEAMDAVDTADAEEQEEEDATPPEQEFNPYVAWIRLRI